MRIDINQKKIAIGDKYQIFIDGQPAYKASNELFRLLSVINLFKSDDSRARLTINKQRHDDNAVSYDIGNIGGQVREFDPYWRAK